MRHKPRRRSQVAGDNPAGRTRNHIKGNRVQELDEFDFDMSGPSQVQRPKPSRTGNQHQSNPQRDDRVQWSRQSVDDGPGGI